MEKKKIIVLVLISVFLAVTTPYFLQSFFLIPHTLIPSFHYPFEHLVKKDPYLPVKTLFGLVNIGLIIPLLYIYSKLYRNVPNRFTLGLLMVMISLLLYAITAGPFMTHIFGLHSFNDGPLQFLPNLFTTLALIVLVKISLE